MFNPAAGDDCSAATQKFDQHLDSNFPAKMAGCMSRCPWTGQATVGQSHCQRQRLVELGYNSTLDLGDKQIARLS